MIETDFQENEETSPTHGRTFSMNGDFIICTPTEDKNSWTTLSNDKIFQRSAFACDAYMDRYILIAGGLRRGGRALSSSVMYDTYHKTCTNLPDVPFTDDYVGVIFDGSFFIHSIDDIYGLSLSTKLKWEPIGYEIDNYTEAIVANSSSLFILRQKDMYQYDPIKGRFSTLPPVPTKRSFFATAVVENKIFIIGGFEYPSTTFSDVEVLDIATKSWKRAPPLPKPLQAASATVFKRWIIVSGGESDLEKLNKEIFIFDTLQQKWTINELGLSPPRKFHKSLSIGYQIISVGGYDENDNDCAMETIQTKELIPEHLWDINDAYEEKKSPSPRGAIISEV